MINIKSEREIELLEIAGSIVYETHKYLKPFIKEGITTEELDTLAEDFIRSKGATPSCKGYQGFPKTLCISINQEVVHGIPGPRKLKNGDIVTLDICACYKGYHGDSAWTYAVGDISDEAKALMKETEEALYEGVKMIKPGNHFGDNLHEDPNIPNYGKAGLGPVIKEGMVFAVEPMLTLGSPDICILDDGWTIETYDESLAAHFEHTVVVTKEGYKILTGESER